MDRLCCLARAALLSASLLALPLGAQESRFERTVDALQLAEAPLRADFASIALAELSEIYLAEADLARSESRLAAGDTDLFHWARAVEQFAEQLLLVQEDVSIGLPVELRRYYREVPAVYVAGRTVMLAHPRQAQQAAFEQRVLARFCAGAPCTRLTGGGEPTAPIPVAPPMAVPAWEFSAAGPLCRYRGLTVQFASAADLARQRTRCVALVTEAEALAAELAWQSRHGVDISWNALAVSATPLRPEHLVMLNTAGDSLLLSLPVINATPGLLEAIGPWLRTRYGEGEPMPVYLDARSLGWD